MSVTVRSIVGVATGAGIGAFPYVLHREVPLLDLFDLGIHELGHMVFGFFPPMIAVGAGSAAQILVPLGLGLYFLIRNRSWVEFGVCLSWTGTSMHDVSIYIADAPIQALPLIGGGHDWAYLLGPQQFDAIHAAGSIASTVSTAGAVAVVAGIVACLWPVLAEWAAEDPIQRRRVASRPGSRR